MSNNMKTIIKRINKRVLGIALVMLLLVSSVNGYVYDSDIQVNIEIDGIPAKTISTSVSTVEEVLAESGMELMMGDVVSPAEDIKLIKNSTVNVKRMKNVTIYNGDVENTVETNASTTKELAEEATAVIGENNTVVLMETGDHGSVVDGGTYVVKHAFPVNIYADYATYPVMIAEGTVADAIALSGIALDENDLVYPDSDSDVYQGMEVTVTRVAQVHDTQTIEIPFEVEYRINKNLKVGEEVMVVEGSAGEMVIDNVITFHNGEAVTYDTNETVVKPAVNTIIECGVWNVRRNDQNAAPAVGTVNGYSYSKVISAKATAYCDKGKTASGIQSKVGVVAVDPRVIPLGTRLYIEAVDGSWSYGVCLAGDTGGLIKGNRVDLFYDEYNECMQFGRRSCNIYVLAD